MDDTYRSLCRYGRDEARFFAAYGADCDSGHSALLKAVQRERIKRGEVHARASKYGTPTKCEHY